MPIDDNLLEQLLHEEEGSALDFKRDQYPFEGPDRNAKGELIKDILAFANAWRRTTAFILIGVDEVKGGRSKIVGVNKHLDDAKLHQFVNSKTQRPVEFSYQPFHTKDGEIGVIEIPIQKRPFYLKKQFGKVTPNSVYKRDGSSTAIATPDEVATMGAEQHIGGIPQLALHWADIDRRAILSSPLSVSTLILDPQLPDDTFENPNALAFDFRNNRNFYKEAIRYAFDMSFMRPFGLQLCNQSPVVARRVRFVGSINKGETRSVLDHRNHPTRPYRNPADPRRFSVVPLAQQLRNTPDPYVQELPNRWDITIDFGDVRPRDEVWTSSELLIGSIGGVTTLKGELRGDNLPEPILCALEINFEVKRRPMEVSDVEPCLDDQ